MSTYIAQGLLYFITHPRLWKLTICPVLLTLVVGIASVIVLFAGALYPQAEGLESAGVPAWLAWILSILLVIIEIFLVTLIYSLIIQPCYQDRVFEYVLEAKGFGDLVHNEANHSSCGRVCRVCCKVSVCMRLLLLVVSLPLNLIPIVGTLAYLWLNGALTAWEHHLYYFELKGFDYADQKAIVDARHAQYAGFGMQALFLEMIPGVGALFLFTNTVGAALFAVEIEREMRAAPAEWTHLSTQEGNKGNATTQVAGYQVV
jgi:uncharacterized protein involved in cysteine biosynthesis